MDADDRALPETALEADRARDLRRPETADLDVGRDADPEVAALRARRRLLAPQAVVADVRQRLVERCLVVAAVVLQPGDDVVAVVERRNQIASPDFDRVDAKLVREHVEHALEHEGRFGTAGATIGFDRRGVGVDAVDVFFHGRDVYGPDSISPCRMVGMPGAAVDRYAPMPAHTVQRRPRMRPSFVAASSTSCT